MYCVFKDLDFELSYHKTMEVPWYTFQQWP
jgi:hypothetical protein